MIITSAPDSISSISDWFTQAVPKPVLKNSTTQIGCHFEEVAEMINTLTSSDGTTRTALQTMSQGMHLLAEMVKSRGLIEFKRMDNVQAEMLDALCDQVVTAVGVGHMMGFDMVGAIREVDSSNWSKFVDGKPKFDENQKIQKGPSYFRPGLKDYTKKPVSITR